MKKGLAAAVLFIFVVLAAGCETSTGFAKGVGYTAYSTAEGVPTDTINLWKFIQAADAWVKRNLW